VDTGSPNAAPGTLPPAHQSPLRQQGVPQPEPHRTTPNPLPCPPTTPAANRAAKRKRAGPPPRTAPPKPRTPAPAPSSPQRGGCVKPGVGARLGERTPPVGRPPIPPPLLMFPPQDPPPHRSDLRQGNPTPPPHVATGPLAVALVDDVDGPLLAHLELGRAGGEPVACSPLGGPGGDLFAVPLIQPVAIQGRPRVDWLIDRDRLAALVADQAAGPKGREVGVAVIAAVLA